MAKIELELVLKAVDEEDELSDEMPEEMFLALGKLFETRDRIGFAETLRIFVRVTKEGIRNRIIKYSKGA